MRGETGNLMESGYPGYPLLIGAAVRRLVDGGDSRRQERLAREAAEEAAAKAAAITVDPQPLELESASDQKKEG